MPSGRSLGSKSSSSSSSASVGAATTGSGSRSSPNASSNGAKTARGTANVMWPMAPGCAAIQVRNSSMTTSASKPCGPAPNAPTISVSVPLAAAMRSSASTRARNAVPISRSERWFSSAWVRLGSGMASTSARRISPS